MLFGGTAVVVALYLLIDAIDPLWHVGGLKALVDLGGSAAIGIVYDLEATRDHCDPTRDRRRLG
jgi:hypothetical protein